MGLTVINRFLKACKILHVQPARVVRFDGVRFTIFNKSNSPGISSNRFLWLHEDAHGDVWASTEDGGVVRYHEAASPVTAWKPD